MRSELAITAALVVAAMPVLAAELEVSVRSTEGAPMAQVVVTVDGVPGTEPAPPPDTATVDQVNRIFVPHVAVVRTGTAVSFPNRDDIRHHVYSFSPAKTFELPLYKGIPAEPVVFDQAGVVTLACNIHDWMLAYVYVTDSRWSMVTADDGIARFSVPDHDSYRVTVWHPVLGPDAEGIVREVPREADGTTALEVALEPAEPRGARRLRRGGGRYR